MRFLAPVVFSVLTAALLGLLAAALIRVLHSDWWQRRAVRWALVAVPSLTALSMLAWGTGWRYQNDFLMRTGSVAAAVTVTAMLAVILALPFSGTIHLLDRWLERRAQRTPDPHPTASRSSRRTFLKATAVAFPVAAVSLGKVGIARSFQDTRVYRRRLRFDHLPPGVEGLRILHLTDSHLGILRFMPEIETILEKALRHAPDLVVFTGDIADDLDLLPGALRMASRLEPKLGVYACLGNHEYGRGIGEVFRTFERSPVTLLVNKGTAIRVNDTEIYLAGADDPRRMHGDPSTFLRQTVRRALHGAPNSAFKILLSHRPQGFDAAARLGVDLTLAGHTHGGQVGLNGRSFWARFMPERYLWGEYRIGRARMYLSSGIGHWFPFRLGCPPEAPIIELTSR